MFLTAGRLPLTVGNPTVVCHLFFLKITLQKYTGKKRGYSFCDQTRQKRDEMACLSDEQAGNKPGKSKSSSNCMEYISGGMSNCLFCRE
jgi:hypothetical protein